MELSSEPLTQRAHDAEKRPTDSMRSNHMCQLGIYLTKINSRDKERNAVRKFDIFLGYFSEHLITSNNRRLRIVMDSRSQTIL